MTPLRFGFTKGMEIPATNQIPAVKIPAQKLQSTHLHMVGHCLILEGARWCRKGWS